MNQHINVLKNLSFLYCVSYGIWYSTWDVLGNVTFSVCVLSISGFLLFFLRIPAPPKKCLEDIIGKDSSAVHFESEARMKSIAHRGASLDAPENSLEAFQHCLQNGMKFVEFDVMLTVDNVPIVFHDKSLERLTDSVANVYEMKYEELLQFDISRKHAFGHKYKNTRIPTLEATVDKLLSDGQSMFIDLKCFNNKIVNVITELYEKYPQLYTRAIVTSFYPVSLYLIRKKNPKIVTALIWRPNLIEELPCSSFRFSYGAIKDFWAGFIEGVYEWTLLNFVYYLLGISLILIRKDGVSANTVKRWRDRDVRVIAWTVNSPIEKHYFARILQIPYLTDTLTAESSTHSADH